MPRPKVRNAELRSVLLDGAVEVLQREGPGAVRARTVATAAGTSTAALYELFGDKAGLIRAIFYEGFERLRARLAAVATDGAARDAVVGLLDASREFAIENPMLFEVMFARPFAEFRPSPEDRRTAAEIYRLVFAQVSRWVNAVGVDHDPVDVAHALIATNRGLIAEELAGVLGRQSASVERRRSLALGAVLDGLSIGGA